VSLLSGLRVGARSGLRAGLDPSDGDPMSGVSRDASSNVYCPATAGEWATTLSAAGLSAGNPIALHLLQEASGNAADAIGTFTLTASGTLVAYQQAIAGWTRKAITTTAGGTGKLQNVDVGLPDIATTSMLVLGYARTTTIGTTRDVIGAGAAATRLASQAVATTGQARGISNGTLATGTIDSGGVVRPWVSQIDRTASTTALYTDAEKIVPAFGATAAGQSITLGNFSAGAGTVAYLYLAVFAGAAAERSPAQIKTLLTTLGWSVLWT
jgi:hypothetical protein